MARILLIVTLCICLCMEFPYIVHCVLVKFYENGDFTGSYHESNSTLKCNNFPGNKSPFVKSIRTDTCLIIYLDINCRSPYSWKIMPPEVSDGEYRLGSFHICNNEEGGPTLNVDITEYYDIFNPMKSPKILESYHNVCNCVNIPKYIQLLDEWSVNNHGNELLAYYSPDCSDRKWEPKLLPAGHSLDSRKLYMHQMTDSRTNQRFGIQSFGPNIYSLYYQQSCYSNGAGGATKKTTTANVSQVQWNENDTDVCRIDKGFMQIVQDGFQQQMAVYSDLMKKITDLEKSVRNFVQCSQNKNKIQ